MQHVSTDRRAARTREAIRSHFIGLLLRKNFNEITVKDIADAADIGRGTFYLHYTDKYDLLETVIDEGLKETVSRFRPSQFIQAGTFDSARMVAFVTSIFAHFQKNENFFRAMLFNEGISSFSARMQQSFMRKFYSEIQNIPVETRPSDPIALEILPIFISSGMLGLIGWWFRNDMRITKEDIANRVLKMMTKGPLRTLGFSIR